MFFVNRRNAICSTLDENSTFMHIRSRSGNIASSGDGNLLYLSDEPSMRLLRFEDEEDDSVVFSNRTQGLIVRLQDAEIYDYCSKFNKKSALYADIRLKGGAIKFKNGVSLIASKDKDGINTIYYRSTIMYDDSWLLDRGFHPFHSDVFSAVYIKGYIYITKVFRNPHTLVLSISLCMDRTKPMRDLIDSEHKREITFEVILRNYSAPVLSVPILDNTGKRVSFTDLEGFSLVTEQQLVDFVIDTLENWGNHRFVIPIKGYYFTDRTAVIESLVIDSKFAVQYDSVKETDERYDMVKNYGICTLREVVDTTKTFIECPD